MIQVFQSPGPRGVWIDVPYSAGDYTALTGTWTVQSADLKHYRYRLVGKELMVRFAASDTALSNITNEIYVKLPGSMLAAYHDHNACNYTSPAGSHFIGYVVSNIGSNLFVIQRENDASLSFQAGATNIAFELTTEIQ